MKTIADITGVPRQGIRSLHLYSTLEMIDPDNFNLTYDYNDPDFRMYVLARLGNPDHTDPRFSDHIIKMYQANSDVEDLVWNDPKSWISAMGHRFTRDELLLQIKIIKKIKVKIQDCWEIYIADKWREFL